MNRRSPGKNNPVLASALCVCPLASAPAPDMGAPAFRHVGKMASERMRRAAVRRRPSSGWIDPAQLATRLATARTLPELLETRRRFAPEMDFSHAPVAWSRLARLRRRPAERAWLDENLPFLEPLAAHTAELVEQSEDIEAGRRAALASALVAAGVRSEPPWNELWDAIERRSVESAPLSECDECASVAEALVNAATCRCKASIMLR